MDARGYGNYSRPAVNGSFTMKVRLINKQRGLFSNQFLTETRLIIYLSLIVVSKIKTRDKRQLQQLHIENPHWFRSISI